MSAKWDDRVRFALSPTSDRVEEDERRLGQSRASILVETSRERPDDAYVSIPRSGTWYSIREGDEVSKANVELLGNIILIQAKVPQVPTTPVVIPAAR